MPHASKLDSEPITYQEECVGQEGISKDGPANPAPSSLTGVQDLSRHHSDDNSHKLVARVSHQIEQLRVIVDAKNVRRQLQTQNLEEDHRNGCSGDRAQKLRVKIAPESSQ